MAGQDVLFFRASCEDGKEDDFYQDAGGQIGYSIYHAAMGGEREGRFGNLVGEYYTDEPEGGGPADEYF